MKKRNEDNPDIQEDNGEELSAEVLKKLNQLLEILHQTGHTNNGSKIELVYVASGGQHVETQIIAYPPPLPKGREKGADASTAERFGKDTPLSTLFRTNFHEKLRTVIESWRPYLIGDDTTIDALAMTHFEFDKKQIHSKDIYVDVLDLVDIGALQVSLSQLAYYLSEHSNLSSSYTALYQQLKHYRQEWL